MSDTLELARALIERPSVTPEDAGCQQLIGAEIKPLGFTLESIDFGSVSNLWARRGGSSPLLVFAGHTDVVPPGPEESWNTAPFSPTVADGKLMGRGAADMKGSLAAMVGACHDFIADHPDHRGSIAFLITSDEEGDALNGTSRVVEALQQREEIPDWCLVGEPTSEKHIADTVKNGRRGTMTGDLTINGVQGHVAYPHLASNPIHLALPAIVELCQQEWDRGDENFPPTTFQCANIRAGTGAENVIPGELYLQFNFRFAPSCTPDTLKERVAEILAKHKLDYQLTWRRAGLPYITKSGILLEAATAAVSAVTGRSPSLSTAGGTSDGRFIAPLGVQVVELGPLSRTIHQANEQVAIDDLLTLRRIYAKILQLLLAS